MKSGSLQLTYGIEEEFFLTDPDTRDLARDVPGHFMRDCRVRFGERVKHEMFCAQVETATPILHTAAAARESLCELRHGISRVAKSADMLLVASGTHPLAKWEGQAHTDRPRYDALIDEYQVVGRRNLLCGLHVHVGIPEGIDRVALMNRMMPWTPLFLAVSTSSPFWGGRRTGLLSYRQAAYDEWPRSGIPDEFRDETEYASFVDLLAHCGALRDGSDLWWALRPSARYRTLELRIADACTRVEDALAIAAAFRCLVRAHIRRPELGIDRTALARRVIDENRWRAKRHGTLATFIDACSGEAVALPALLSNMVGLVAEDADSLRCEPELRRFEKIPELGTSADAQLAIYRRGRQLMGTQRAALASVVDWLASRTVPTAGAAASTAVATDQDVACAVNA